MNQLCLELSRLPRANTGDLDWPFIFDLTDKFLAGGGVYFETGMTLLSGRSEEVVRRALTERHRREEFCVLDKLPLDKLETAEDCEKLFTQQSTKCGTVYFDLYLLDWLNRDNYRKAQDTSALDFLARLKEDGRAKRIGFSFYGDPTTLKTILEEHPEMDVVQLQVNYLDWESEYLRVRECCETAAALGKAVIGTDPFKNHLLTSLPETTLSWLPAGAVKQSVWARRFARSRTGVEFVSECIDTIELLNEAIQETAPLTNGEERSLRAVGKALVNCTMTISCVSCNYCMHCCPREIASPEYFRLFNEYSRAKNDLPKLKPFYSELVGEHGRASDCVHCGSCENACPQRLLVTKWLYRVASTFE